MGFMEWKITLAGLLEMIINKEKIDKVKGFLDEREANYLYKLALKAGKNGPCLEIGSYCGKSSVYLGAACKENSTVLFSIDHHGGSEEQQPDEAYFDPDLLDKEIGKIDTLKPVSYTHLTLPTKRIV